MSNSTNKKIPDRFMVVKCLIPLMGQVFPFLGCLLGITGQIGNWYQMSDDAAAREEHVMNIDEQFENFLAELGVEMERPEDRQLSGDSIPEISIFQASRDHYG